MRPQPSRYRADPDIAAVAALIAEPVRAAILFALLDGRELPAGELALRAAASPQAASTHLAKLVAGGLILPRPVGRQRLFRLASAEIGVAIEALAAIAPARKVVALGQSASIQHLREARSCYDHLAGKLGVALTQHFLASKAIRLLEGDFVVTRRGEEQFSALGIDIAEARAKRRGFARACMDWTERRPHLAGSLGAAVRERFLAAGWVERNPHDRALRVTAKCTAELARLGIRLT